MTNSYAALRENEIKRVGLATQLQAEAKIDMDQSQPFVERYEPGTGIKRTYRKHLADILTRRKEAEMIVTHSTPSEEYRRNYDLIDWGFTLVHA